MSFLSRDVFSMVVSSTPLVSIDIVIRDDGGRYLLGKRKTPPAKGFWFVPGGRIYKNETLSHAFERISYSELGVILKINNASLVGVFDHLYPDSIFSADTSTHYVAIGYSLSVSAGFCPDNYMQHSDYKWFTQSELLAQPDVHTNTKLYFQSN